VRGGGRANGKMRRRAVATLDSRQSVNTTGWAASHVWVDGDGGERATVPS